MIHYFSKRVADFCLYKNVIAAERYALYVYGTELLISSFISLLTLVIISIILGTFKESVLFFLAFVSLRKYTGGFHCKTYFKCNCMFIFTYLLCITALKTMTYFNLSRMILFGCFFMASMIIVSFAPIENVNKPILENKKMRIKVYSILVFFIHLLVYVVFDRFRISCGMIIPITDFIVAISMLLSFTTTEHNMEVN
ncbi:MAG: accessory gene regulator B family protein [Clostridia bacterium]|nr:accessory gene regulator B family protein [Clostridia bacterium]